MADKKLSDDDGAGLRVLFGNRAALSRDLAPITVLIVPSDDGWNDFGHYTRIDYKIRMRAESDPAEK